LRVPLRVLIVEALPEQAELVAHELTNAGFLLAWSIASEPDACRSAIEAGVDVVVADCDAVEIDLRGLMAMVGELSDPPPVVSVSTDDSEEVARECLRAGASAFLHKFRLDEIGNLVRSLTEGRGSRSAAVSQGGLADPRTFAENACDLIVEISSDGRLLYVNPSVEKKLGYTVDELRGRRVFEFLHPEDLPVALDFLRKARETGSASRGAHRARRRDGSWCWLDSAGNPYRTPDGERRIVAISREVSEHSSNALPAARCDTSVEGAMRSTGQAAAGPAAVGPEEAGREIILLVEGEDPLRSVIRQTLEEEGYVVLPAASGEEALERAARHSGPIHLVLSDAVMPGIDGRELAERVAASHPGIRVILMSDSPGGGMEPLPKGIRAPSFLRAPFTLAALRAKLHEAFEENPDRGESG
jgi:PAS domain S-box-containing protein